MGIGPQRGSASACDWLGDEAQDPESQRDVLTTAPGSIGREGGRRECAGCRNRRDVANDGVFSRLPHILTYNRCPYLCTLRGRGCS